VRAAWWLLSSKTIAGAALDVFEREPLIIERAAAGECRPRAASRIGVHRNAHADGDDRCRKRDHAFFQRHAATFLNPEGAAAPIEVDM